MKVMFVINISTPGVRLIAPSHALGFMGASPCSQPVSGRHVGLLQSLDNCPEHPGRQLLRWVGRPKG